MSRRWYNRDKAREMIRMAMDSAPRRHHPRMGTDEKPPWEEAAVPKEGRQYTKGTVLQSQTSWDLGEPSPLSLPSPGSQEEQLPAAVRDQRTLEQIRNLASETPDVMRTLLRSTKTPAMAKIRLIEIILDRAFGKAEATVNVNATTRSLEASETRIEALIRAIRVESGEET